MLLKIYIICKGENRGVWMWNLDDSRGRQAFEISCYSKMSKIKLMDRITNDKILNCISIREKRSEWKNLRKKRDQDFCWNKKGYFWEGKLGKNKWS